MKTWVRNLLIGILGLSFLLFIPSVSSAGDKFPIGTKVKIVKDIRPGSPASGKIAEYIGHDKDDGWYLIDADGKPRGESRTLPPDYIKWSPENEDFPGVKSAIQMENPVFKLDDGSLITGINCYWEVVDEELEKKFMSEVHESFRKAGEKIDKYRQSKGLPPIFKK